MVLFRPPYFISSSLFPGTTSWIFLCLFYGGLVTSWLVLLLRWSPHRPAMSKRSALAQMTLCQLCQICASCARSVRFSAAALQSGTPIRSIAQTAIGRLQPTVERSTAKSRPLPLGPFLTHGRSVGCHIGSLTPRRNFTSVWVSWIYIGLKYKCIRVGWNNDIFLKISGWRKEHRDHQNLHMCNEEKINYVEPMSIISVF